MNTTLPINTVIPFSPPYDETGVALSVAFFFPLCILGIVGNTVTIATIIWSPKLNSPWYDLIVSLSISDLLSAIISPLYVYRRIWGFDKWSLPEFLCKVYWGVDIWTSSATVVHILWFAILRFISIQWPHDFKRFIGKYSKISIVLIWIISFFTSLPHWIFAGSFDRDRSDPHPTSKWSSCAVSKEILEPFMILSIIRMTLFRVIPFVLVILFSLGIGIRITRMRKNRRNKARGNQSDKEGEKRKTRKENQLLLQLYLIVGSFLFGYGPKITFLLFTMFAKSSPNQYKIHWWLGFSEYLLMRISECLNPVFYNLSSSQMRQETLAFVKQVSQKMGCKNGDAPRNRDVCNSPNIAATSV